MTENTILTLFSGGELAGVGAREAGFDHIGGVEYDPAIAEVAHANGFDLMVKDIRQVKPSQFDRPTLLHASPVCTRASQANTKGVEAVVDMEIAQKVVDFINAMKPRYFTLENVIAYRHFKSFGFILKALSGNGYMFSVEHLNAADFGVPQIRRRLFVRAVRGGLVPYIPKPVSWVGWFEAIEDMIDELPESQFADWQIACMPEIKQSMLIGQHRTPKTGIVQYSKRNNPSFTITASSNQLSNRAFLMSGENASSSRPIEKNEPAFTISSSQKAAHRAWLRYGKVVKLNACALARLQGIPDSYILPDRPILAGKVIGNSIPPKEYQSIVEAFVR